MGVCRDIVMIRSDISSLAKSCRKRLYVRLVSTAMIEPILVATSSQYPEGLSHEVEMIAAAVMACIVLLYAAAILEQRRLVLFAYIA